LREAQNRKNNKFSFFIRKVNPYFELLLKHSKNTVLGRAERISCIIMHGENDVNSAGNSNCSFHFLLKDEKILLSLSTKIILGLTNLANALIFIPKKSMLANQGKR